MKFWPGKLVNNLEILASHELFLVFTCRRLSRNSLNIPALVGTLAINFKNSCIQFQPEELRGRNVRGVAGKQPLNPDKVKVIMDAVCKFYPAPPEGRDFQWRDCRKAVDTYLRGIKFSERNQ